MSVIPAESQVATVIMIGVRIAIKRNVVLNFGAYNIPGISISKPKIRLLNLISVLYLLIKDSVIITDSIPYCRDTQCCHGIKKAGCKSAQATISKTCVPFCISYLVIIQSDLFHGFCSYILHSKVDEHIVEQSPDQILHRDVIHSLFVVVVVALLCIQPAVMQTIHHG